MVCDVIITPQLLIHVLFFLNSKLKIFEERKKSKLLLLFSERDIFFSNNDVACESQTTSTIFRGEENGGVKSALRLM